MEAHLPGNESHPPQVIHAALLARRNGLVMRVRHLSLARKDLRSKS